MTPLPKFLTIANNPNQQANFNTAITKPSTSQHKENTSNNNEHPSLSELDDETMISHDSAEPNQVTAAPSEGHHETSSDNKEDMVT